MKSDTISSNFKLPMTLGAIVFLIGASVGASAWATSIDYTLKQHTELLKEIRSDFKTVVGNVHTNHVRLTKVETRGD